MNKANEKRKLHITVGNSKIGKIHNLSTLPGDKNHLITKKDGTVLSNVPGTCSGNCSYCFHSGCYAVNAAIRYSKTVIPAWEDNTILLRSGKMFDMVDDYITTRENSDRMNKVKLFRINVSGEIQNVNELIKWNEIAKKHKGTTFGLYTKNYTALEKFLEKTGGSEDNFVINVSQWHGCADTFLKKYAGKVNVFTYDDSNKKNNVLSKEDKKHLASLRHCPAVLQNGKHAKTAAGDDITCDKCRRCYTKTCEETAVYSH